MKGGSEMTRLKFCSPEEKATCQQQCQSTRMTLHTMQSREKPTLLGRKWRCQEMVKRKGLEQEEIVPHVEEGDKEHVQRPSVV